MKIEWLPIFYDKVDISTGKKANPISHLKKVGFSGFPKRLVMGQRNVEN